MSGFESVVEEERRLLEERACAGKPWQQCDGCPADYTTGLAFSGGGMRSACIALGVLQRLAQGRLIRHIDYLSTVSGGGYIASGAVLSYAGSAACDPDAAFPFAKGSTSVEHLRQHASYLAPAGARSLATGFFVIARSMLINGFMWVMIGGILMAALIAGFRESTRSCFVLPSRLCAPTWAVFDRMLLVSVVIALVLLGLMAFVAIATRPHLLRRSRGSNVATFTGISAVLLVAYVRIPRTGSFGLPSLDRSAYSGRHVMELTMLLVLLFAFIGMFRSSRFSWRRRRVRPTPVFQHGMPGSGLDLLTLNDGVPSPTSYRVRRFLDDWAGLILLVGTAVGIVGATPLIHDLLVRSFGASDASGRIDAGLLATVSYMASAASAMYAYYQTHLRGKLGFGTAFVLVAGSLLLCIATVLLATLVGGPLLFAWDAFRADPERLPLAPGTLLAAAILALVLATMTNPNAVSLGRYYRDRLMETFMADAAGGSARNADLFPLAAIGREKPLVGPYPLINTRIVTARSRDPVDRRRGGASFSLSPLYCGPVANCWRRTGDLVGGELTLATATATSGAAVNPFAGLTGRGIGASYLVGVAMMLLNLKLGYSLRWGQTGLAWRVRQFLNPHGNFFFPRISDALADIMSIRSTDPTFVELSDGGHFENLGLYELIRRRCGLIIVCDGGEEPGRSHAPFYAAKSLIEEDFGADIRFDRFLHDGPGRALSSLRDMVSRPTEDEYPAGVEFARRGFFVASIHYRQDRLTDDENPGSGHGPRFPAIDGPKHGLLIYLKAAMLERLAAPTRGYRGDHPAFPFEPTIDQFFVPEQMEAYRDVGYSITDQMLEETGLLAMFDNCRPSLKHLMEQFDPCSTQPMPRDSDPRAAID